jgi:hypothetical protein
LIGRYDVAAGNLAFLYGLPNSNHVQQQQNHDRVAKYLHMATDIEASLRLGDCYYYGTCGVPKQDFELALRWYTRASVHGLSVGAYNVGYMHEYGIGGMSVNLERAARYYRRALVLSPSLETYVVVFLALWRVEGRPFWLPFPFEFAPEAGLVMMTTLILVLTWLGWRRQLFF